MASNGGYSAEVGLSLVINGVTLALSHIGNSGLMVRDHCEPMPACEATLLVRVDDSRKKRQVFLPMGIPGAGKFVPFF